MDPVLCAHQVPSSKEVYYDISGIYPSSAVSIRDQMLRASLVIEKAIQTKKINNRTDEKAKPLLIVGAGFAGVISAIKAAQKGIPTFLVEREPTILNRFLESERLVSPSHYDFPHPHWSKNKFPWNRSKIIPQVSWRTEQVLKTATDFIGKVASLKSEGYLLFIAKNTICEIKGNISLLQKTPLVQAEFFPVGTYTIPSKFQSEVAKYPQGFGIVLSCLGVGKEFVESRQNYRSYHFWALDTEEFRKKNLSTLIVGAGDGGLQDFLLLSTKLSSAAEIYEKVSKVFPLDIKHQVEKEIFRTHDIRCREELWHGSDKRFGCETYTKNHQSYVDLVNDLFKADKDKKIILAIHPIISDLFTTSSIHLAYSCKHFNRCYPLNHFLVLLLNKFCEFTGKKSFLLPDTMVTEIIGKDHVCEKKPYICENKEHLVKYVKKTCRQKYKSTETLNIKPRLILLRYGIDVKSKIKNVETFYASVENINKKLQKMSGTKILPYTLP